MNIVEIRDFCFAYPDCSSKVLDQVNLSIQEGTLNVICGRSGCGKSTLLRHLKSVLSEPEQSDEGCGIRSAWDFLCNLSARSVRYHPA